MGVTIAPAGGGGPVVVDDRFVRHSGVFVRSGEVVKPESKGRLRKPGLLNAIEQHQPRVLVSAAPIVDKALLAGIDGHACRVQLRDRLDRESRT